MSYPYSRWEFMERCLQLIGGEKAAVSSAVGCTKLSCLCWIKSWKSPLTTSTLIAYTRGLRVQRRRSTLAPARLLYRAVNYYIVMHRVVITSSWAAVKSRAWYICRRRRQPVAYTLQQTCNSFLPAAPSTHERGRRRRRRRPVTLLQRLFQTNKIKWPFWARAAKCARKKVDKLQIEAAQTNLAPFRWGGARAKCKIKNNKWPGKKPADSVRRGRFLGFRECALSADWRGASAKRLVVRSLARFADQPGCRITQSRSIFAARIILAEIAAQFISAE